MAASTASERVFSMAGHVANGRRANLVVFVNERHNFFQQYS